MEKKKALKQSITSIYKRDSRSPVPKNDLVSRVMSRIKGTETKPEQKLRRLLIDGGIKGYRKNLNTLPGKPDIVFTRLKVAIFVNGCFWHGCDHCGRKKTKHNTEYWSNKIQTNINRDVNKRVALEHLGYQVYIVWEHQIKGSQVDSSVIEIIEYLQKRINQNKV